MNDVRQQDIVWIRFPYSDMAEAKFRPALILSNNPYNRTRRDVVACAITSKLDMEEYSVLIDQSHISEGRMPLKSRIRADKILTIEKTLIAGKLARLGDKQFGRVAGEVMKLLKRSRSSP